MWRGLLFWRSDTLCGSNGATDEHPNSRETHTIYAVYQSQPFVESKTLQQLSCLAMHLFADDDSCLYAYHRYLDTHHIYASHFFRVVQADAAVAERFYQEGEHQETQEA